MRNAGFARPITLLAIASTLMALASPGEAQRRAPWPPDYERSYETRRPAHGYSGWVLYGGRQYYCDYIRRPNRRCWVDRRGRERCRVVGWTLEQRCD